MSKTKKFIIIIMPILVAICILFLVRFFSLVNVTFDAGLGEFTNGESKIVVKAEKGDLLEDVRFEVPKREGYVFVGWANEEGQTATSLLEFIDNETLVAIWQMA